MKDLIDLLSESVSACHTVLASERRLAADGFQQLEMSEPWNLAPLGKYYVKHRSSTLFAFTVGENLNREVPVRIAAAHTDFPGLSIKADPQMIQSGYVQLNVEVYGSPILSTWMDRPLSAAGKVAVRSEQPLKPRVIYADLGEPFAVIPNLAIHMNREINKGVELDRQLHLLPVIGLQQNLSEGESFLRYLAEKIHVKAEDILDFDLQLYSVDVPCPVGMKRELISASHLDNTTSVYAILKGIMGEISPDGVNLIAMFDNEEIGSRTAQGAGSIEMRLVLEKILSCLGVEHVDDVLYDSMLFSVDVAHAVHPNYAQKADPVLQPKPGNGFCIKEACSQSYATDSSVVAAVQQICESGDIPYQKYANRSSIAGGGTIGNIMAVNMPAAVADLGVPILAMHSARELAAVSDVEALASCVHRFFHL